MSKFFVDTNILVYCMDESDKSFRDALIVAAAESARCEKIWTEDLNDGQVIRGVRIENPLKMRE